jgi:N-acetylglutamate synthase-like GNAT family acetyltransferase
MIIRNYKAEDKNGCIAVFKSNCPKFFDESELDLFIKWLDHQVNENSTYKSPTYTNSEKDAYYVIETPENGIVGCGGFYIIKDSNEARLAWGMIHADFHKHGYGKALYEYRYKQIKANWPNHTITLGTSQHTYPFYEKMGMHITAMFKQGYGPDLDRYDMQQQ